jgi:HlyD family secretion protein
MSQLQDNVASATSGKAPLDYRRSIRRHTLVGIASVFLLFGGVGGWAGTMMISGAVIAPGQLVVESNHKKVQHPTGGVIGELRVREGDRVRAGDVLIRLDETITRANLAIIAKSLDQLHARQARLEAERDGRAAVAIPAALRGRRGEDEVAKLIESEQRLFELRRAARAGRQEQLRERIIQLHQEIEGLVGQTKAKDAELSLIADELKGVRELWSKNLIPLQRVSALDRGAARLDGERNMLVAATAQTHGRISEINLQILQVDQDVMSEAARELREIEARVAELSERKIAAEDQLKRIDIRAPQDGVVHNIAVHTVGGVIAPGEELMLIVPEADALTIEAMVEPRSIDRVTAGQKVVLRFSAFNQRTTPEILGEVARVSADLTKDARTGATFYKARIHTVDEQIARLGGVRLIPGMPVEAFIQTGERTAISYLVKPLADQLNRAWRGQ